MSDVSTEHDSESADDHEDDPEHGDDGVETITEGYFEEEYYISADDAGQFLIDLGEQLGADEEITINGDDWELPFRFGEPVNLDIEFEGGSEPELEIEVELAGRTQDEAPELS